MGGKVYTFIFIAFATGTLLNWILSKQTSNGNINYEVLFYILAGMAAVAFILALFFKDYTLVVKSEEIEESNNEKKKLIINKNSSDY